MALFPHDPWVIAVVKEGVRLTFHTPLPLVSYPSWISVPKNPNKASALRLEVQALLRKRAIETVVWRKSPGFYSHLFVVPKPGGRWRPVIDLSVLNKYLVIPKFKMETARALRRSIRQNDYAVSIDLSDAYLHVPMHRNTRRYLRFAIDGEVYTFTALPFGVSIAPWVFTRLMDAVVSLLRQRTVSEVSNYLDDCLQKHQDPVQLSNDLSHFLLLLESLGFMVNREKSALLPSQSFVHLGMSFQTNRNLVFPSDKRVRKLVELGQSLLSLQRSTPRTLHQFLGSCVATSDLVPLGGVHLRPLQWALSDIWTPQSSDWDCSIPITTSLRQALSTWTNVSWLTTGVPIRPVPPSISLCTDASGLGWGAHLLPSFQVTQGVWGPTESLLHSNDKEMLAVHRALQAWLTPISRQSVMVLSDNTAVCSYINRQGGTRSRSLCQHAVDLLTFCHANQITIQARHIPGRLNVIADGLSRQRCLHTEWTLHPRIFAAIANLPISRRDSSRRGRFSLRHHREKRLCVPANVTGTVAAGTDGHYTVQRDSGGPSSVETILDNNTPQTVCSTTAETATQSRPVDPTVLRTESPTSRNPEPPCISAIKSRLREKGYAESVINRICYSRRGSTLEVYSGNGRSFRAGGISKAALHWIFHQNASVTFLSTFS